MANLLPPNATTLERNLATVMARIGELPAPLRDLVNPATCPAALLPWLASTLSVDAWQDNWTTAQKRAVIAAAYVIHRRKGTLSAVLAALSAVDINAQVIEWWQQTPAGVPHTFRVDVDTEGAGLSKGAGASLDGQISAVKPVRSHFTVRLIATSRPIIYLGAAVQDMETTTIYPQ